MADFKLPMSAGVETSGVSFDPRRQIAPVATGESTQLTQPGGAPGLEVGDTIARQFGDAGPGASADGYTPPTRDKNTEVAQMLEGKYAAKKSVLKDTNKKKLLAAQVKKKDFIAKLDKHKSDLAALKRRRAEGGSIEGQMARRLRMKLGPEAPRPAPAADAAPTQAAPAAAGPAPVKE